MLEIDDPHDWLTQRAAAQQLHEDIGIHPETARRLLVAGLVGRPRMTSLAAFHRRDTVDAFVRQYRAQPPLPVPDRNLVLVRVGNGRVRFGATDQHRLDRLADGWRMSPTWRALCRGVLEAGGRPVGFLVTLGGFVVAGADILGAEWSGADDRPETASPLMTRFDLRPPGEWFDDWHARHLPTGRGGSALRFWALGSRPPWDRTPRERRGKVRAVR
ncbi:hypothetical protein SFC79_15100 [Nocardioides sp. S-58]|uniref:DNA-binding protein n=1 Tax=Nocardioides renjunii TaxID=3095075 RepID=A0ABU5KDR2_9ACTN|nr:hypothetical protein [Nocardioides sp. S-58]MDZ5663103.1 hypothetical protein [Nocardioides sp. S-58]